MNQNTLTLIIGISYVIIFSIGLLGISTAFVTKKRNILKMQANVYSKLQNNIDLTAKDIVFIGRSFNLSAYQSRQVVYRIFGLTNTVEDFKKLKLLVAEIDKEEPFDELPDEVKPSIIRLTKITSQLGEDSDKQILAPVIQVINKYVEMKSEQESLKKKTNRANWLTIISFIIGVVSFYYTVRSPSASDIAKELSAKHIQTNQIQQ
ncbi:hypothetical protein [uncultured Tolumonas sp.]|uniref:hypothetical protein n=1 Tax=uncultured Tolumonas sp. TaxID=263765 RepID=UPI002A0A8A29|nr:hypothetical protein [uncultured Tolumonas sp.]